MKKYNLCEGEAILMTEDKMKLLKEAIREGLEITDRFNLRHISYGYKHMFERLLNFYISNSEFKEAMFQLKISHKNADEEGRNTFYPVSEKSIRKLIQDAGYY